jgi:hypothetical protein
MWSIIAALLTSMVALYVGYKHRLQQLHFEKRKLNPSLPVEPPRDFFQRNSHALGMSLIVFFNLALLLWTGTRPYPMTRAVVMTMIFEGIGTSFSVTLLVVIRAFDDLVFPIANKVGILRARIQGIKGATDISSNAPIG